MTMADETETDNTTDNNNLRQQFQDNHRLQKTLRQLSSIHAYDSQHDGVDNDGYYGYNYNDSDPHEHDHHGGHHGGDMIHHTLRRPSIPMGDNIHSHDTWWGGFRDNCGKFINNRYIQIFLSILLIINAIVLGMLTFDTIQANKRLEQGLEYLDLIILIIFTIEVTLQYIYLGFQFFSHGWMVFDLVIIVLSWAFMSSNLVVLRAFRIFRILLVVKQSSDLRDLFKAVAKVVPKMCSILVIFLVFFYIFSVLFTTLYQDLFEDEYLDWDYFGRLDQTFLTLFQFTTLDSWSVVTRQVMIDSPWAWLGFVAWIVITAFFLLNMIIAVICESMRKMNEVREVRRQRKMSMEQRHMFSMQRDAHKREIRAVLELQQVLLKNQAEMQQTLHVLVQAMASPDPVSTSQGKIGLKKVLDSFHESDDKSLDVSAVMDQENEEATSVGQEDDCRFGRNERALAVIPQAATVDEKDDCHQEEDDECAAHQGKVQQKRASLGSYNNSLNQVAPCNPPPTVETEC